MIVEEETYLEHYGKKGMKWGQRLAKKQLSGPAGKAGYKIGKNIKTRREARTPAQKSRNKKIAIGVGVAAASAAAVVAGRHFAKTRVPNVPLKNIPRTSAAHKAFLGDFMKKQFRLNAAANGDLNTLYKMNDTPMRLREYLPILPGQPALRRL